MVKREDIPKILFGLSLAALVFMIGFATAYFRVFPYPAIRSAIQSAKLIWSEKEMIAQTKPTGHLHPSRYDGSGVVTLDRDKVAEGLTLITSFFDGGPQLRLIEEDGTVVQRWQIEIRDLWSNFDHLQVPENIPRTNWNVLFNGAVMEPDGSVVFVMKGLVKMDWCGAVEWQTPFLAHHSVEPTHDGRYWVPGRHHVQDESRHPPLRAPYELETMVEVSADGKVLREIVILDLLFEHDMEGELFANNRMLGLNPEKDVVHLNDVEEIPPGLLDRFPQFERGDVVLSLREPNMVMVVNPDSRKIKWSKIGPWVQQHDTDWRPDGTIMVFDNRFDRTARGDHLGGSRVVTIDPRTGAVKTLYGDEPNHVLYTATQGDQQILANGNLLMAEAEAGRIIEVTPDGEIVWEYINRYSDTEVLRVSDATKYPRSFFSNLDRTCN